MEPVALIVLTSDCKSVSAIAQILKRNRNACGIRKGAVCSASVTVAVSRKASVNAPFSGYIFGNRCRKGNIACGIRFSCNGYFYGRRIRIVVMVSHHAFGNILFLCVGLYCNFRRCHFRHGYKACQYFVSVNYCIVLAVAVCIHQTIRCNADHIFFAGNKTLFLFIAVFIYSGVASADCYNSLPCYRLVIIKTAYVCGGAVLIVYCRSISCRICIVRFCDNYSEFQVTCRIRVGNCRIFRHIAVGKCYFFGTVNRAVYGVFFRIYRTQVIFTRRHIGRNSKFCSC